MSATTTRKQPPHLNGGYEDAYRLSQHILGGVGVYIAPSRLHRFIREDWEAISMLAHAIHDGGEL